MQKRLLVRRDNSNFIGPMSLEEFARRFKKLEFGFQDEVAASNGIWVKLDQYQQLKQHMPEVAKLVKTELAKQIQVDEFGKNNQIASVKIDSDYVQRKSKPQKNSSSFFILTLLSSCINQ